MKIGITGAAGYIGSRLCCELQEEYEIIPIDNFSKGQVREINGTEVAEADIRNRKLLSDLLTVDAVVHLAAISDVRECEKDRELAWEVNVVGTQNVALICYQKKIPLVFASTMAVFGIPVYTPMNEQHPRHPINFYGLTKVLGEKVISVLSEGNFPSFILVKSNVYGIHVISNTKIQKETVINKFVEKVARGEDLTVYEPGTQSKNFLHITDAVAAYRKAVEKVVIEKEKMTKFYCLCGAKTSSILDLAALVKELGQEKGFHSSVVLTENPVKNESPSTFEVDTSKIRKELGFEPKYTLEKGIKELFDEV